MHKYAQHIMRETVLPHNQQNQESTLLCRWRLSVPTGDGPPAVHPGTGSSYSQNRKSLCWRPEVVSPRPRPAEEDAGRERMDDFCCVTCEVRRSIVMKWSRDQRGIRAGGGTVGIQGRQGSVTQQKKI